MLQVAGYTRVSTDIQTERESIEVQEESIRRFCDLNGLHLVKCYRDEGVSGTVRFEERGSGRIISGLLDRGKAEGIVFTKLDRAFRNASDALTTMDLWNRKGISVFILNFMNGNKFDSRDPLARAMFGMISVFGQLERDMIAERIRESMSHKKSSMQQYCKAVYGYKVVGGLLVEDNDQQLIIESMKEMREKGCTLRQIAGYLNSKSIPTPRGGCFWYASTVREILTNEIHYTEK